MKIKVPCIATGNPILTLKPAMWKKLNHGFFYFI